MKIKGRSTRKHWERKPLITEEPGCPGTPLCVSRGFVWTTQQQRTTRQIRDLFAIVEWPRKRPPLTILTIARCGEGISKTPGQRSPPVMVSLHIPLSITHANESQPSLLAYSARLKSHCRSPLKMDGARNIAPVPETAESRLKIILALILSFVLRSAY